MNKYVALKAIILITAITLVIAVAAAQLEINKDDRINAGAEIIEEIEKISMVSYDDLVRLISQAGEADELTPLIEQEESIQEEQSEQSEQPEQQSPGEKQEKLTQTKIDREEPTATPTPQVRSNNPEPIRVQHLNKETDNLNVLFIGIAEEQLKMVSLYSIDYQETWRSAAMFFPTRTQVEKAGEAILLEEIYTQEGVGGLTETLEQQLEIKVDYHIKVDRQVLVRVAEIIDPIYVEGEQVDIANLFDMEVTPHDDYILGELVKQFRKPSVFFFSLPELFISFRRYISTDFAITPSNLYLHYKVATGIDPTLLTKIIVPGHDYYRHDGWIRVIPEDTWKNIVYRLTKVETNS